MDFSIISAISVLSAECGTGKWGLPELREAAPWSLAELWKAGL